jgi:hypothetical protein
MNFYKAVRNLSKISYWLSVNLGNLMATLRVLITHVNGVYKAKIWKQSYIYRMATKTKLM